LLPLRPTEKRLKVYLPHVELKGLALVIQVQDCMNQNTIGVGELALRNCAA
jgi:hypothetical protein